MVDFTSEQLQEIRNSDEFKEFVEKWEKEGIDRDATLNDYLGNALNRSKWEEKFSDSKDIPLQDEQQSTQEELAKTEHKLETHLHTVYADGILQAGQDLPEKFWETDDYKRWADNYNDKETQEFKDRIQQLQANTNDNKKSFSQKVADEKSSKLDNGEVLSWVEEEKSDKHYQYEIRESTKNANGYLRTNHSFVDRDGQSDHFIINETSRFDKDNKHTQTLKSKNVNARLDGAEFEGIILYGNERNRQEIQAKVVEQENMVILTIDGKYHSFDKDVFTNEEKSKQIETWLQNTQGLSVNEARSVAAGIISTNKDVKDISQILQTHNRAIKGIANPPKVTDIERKKDTIIQDVVYETTQERELSDNSDANEDSLNDLKLDVLLELGYIDQPLYDAAKKDSDKAMDTLREKLPMKKDRLDAFNDAVIDKILDDKSKYAHLAIPQLLADSYKRTKTQLDKEKDEEKITILQNRMDKLSVKMDNLTDQYASGITNITFEQYNYDDNMNVADIYDGYVAMLDVREPDVSAERKQVINSVRTQLDKDIALYDELWGIEKDLSADNSSQLADNHEYLTQQMKEVEITPETYKMLSNIKFLDEQGKPEPQFIDKDGNDAFQYSEGAQIKEGSKLEAIVDFARNNTIIANLTAKDRPSQEDLTQEFQAHIFNDLYAVGKQEQAFRNLQELGKKTTSIDGIEDKEFEEIAAKVKASLENPEINWEISNGGYQAAIKTEVNNTLACINRFGKKLGKDSMLLKKLHTPIAKHDPKAKDRFEKENSLKDWGRTFIWSFGSSIAMKVASMGAYKGLTAAGSTISLGATAGIMAAGLSVTGMAINAKRFKKEAQAKGEKPQWRKFFDPRTSYGRTNAASMCAFAAGACLISGHPVGAAVFGAAGVGIMGVSTYKDARKHGATKKEAWKAVGKKLSAVGAGIATGSLLSSGFGAIEGKEAIKPELIKEGTPEYTTYDYTEAQVDHAETRLYDGRYSEYADGQKIVHHLLQDPNDPSSVDRSLIDTSLKSLDNLAEYFKQNGDYRFYTDVGGVDENGIANLSSNSKVVLYEFLQNLYTNNTNLSVDIDGRAITYMDAFHQITSGEITDHEGVGKLLLMMQDQNNATGHVGRFGDGNIVNGIQTNQHDTTGSYNPNEHAGTDPQYSQGQKAVEAKKFWSVGYWEPVRNAFGKMKDRIGGFADKLLGRKTAKKPDIVVVPTPPVNDQKGIKDKKQDQNPPKDIPVIPTPVPPKDKQEVFKRLSQGENNNDALVNELIEKEYRITRGHLTGEVDKNQVAEYKKLVEAEYQAESSIIRGGNMEVYLKRRMNTFEKVCANRKNEYSETNIAIIANKARQDMWKRNIAVDGEIIDASQTTLLHLTEVANMSSQGNMGSARKAALSPEKDPLPEYKQDRPHGYAVEINPGQTMREKFDRAINQHNAQQIAKIKQSQSK